LNSFSATHPRVFCVPLILSATESSSLSAQRSTSRSWRNKSLKRPSASISCTRALASRRPVDHETPLRVHAARKGGLSRSDLQLDFWPRVNLGTRCMSKHRPVGTPWLVNPGSQLRYDSAVPADRLLHCTWFDADANIVVRLWCHMTATAARTASSTCGCALAEVRGLPGQHRL
jgi:hypothetical protein